LKNPLRFDFQKLLLKQISNRGMSQLRLVSFKRFPSLRIGWIDVFHEYFLLKIEFFTFLLSCKTN